MLKIVNINVKNRTELRGRIQLIAKLPVLNEWDTVDLVITCIHNLRLK